MWVESFQHFPAVLRSYDGTSRWGIIWRWQRFPFLVGLSSLFSMWSYILPLSTRTGVSFFSKSTLVSFCSTTHVPTKPHRQRPYTNSKQRYKTCCLQQYLAPQTTPARVSLLVEWTRVLNQIPKFIIIVSRWPMPRSAWFLVHGNRALHALTVKLLKMCAFCLRGF